jgi:probable phosphoglycerate mutase
MSARTLVLLRHGRTAWNHGLRVQGQLDVELDETGHEQAARAGVAMAGLQPGLLWCSDLARARQTAAYVAKETGLEPTYDPRLREFHLGERQGLTHAEYVALDPDGFERFRRGDYSAAPGAEPTAAVRTRMLEVLHELIGRLGAGQSAVAVSHGAAIRVAVGALLDWPDEQYQSLRGLDNCGWVVVEEHPDTDGLRLTAYNRVV